MRHTSNIRRCRKSCVGISIGICAGIRISICSCTSISIKRSSTDILDVGVVRAFDTSPTSATFVKVVLLFVFVLVSVLVLVI